MLRMIVRRILLTIPLLFLVTIIIFTLSQLVPGDPAVTLAGESATQEQIDEINEKLGYNDPLIVQYVDMVKGLVTGDLGTSLYSTQTVTAALAQTLPVTLSLAALALLMVIVIGTTFGALAGMKPGSILDRSLTVIASLGVAAPAYWVGMIMIIVFTFQLGWLPGSLYVPFADSPRLTARHHADGLRPHGAGQGHAPTVGHRQARDEERGDPGGDRHRSAGQRPARRCRGRRAGLRPQRHRPVGREVGARS
jgi:ABC-type dipeptide/oligopeptide/nickel transport system permease component